MGYSEPWSLEQAKSSLRRIEQLRLDANVLGDSEAKTGTLSNSQSSGGAQSRRKEKVAHELLRRCEKMMTMTGIPTLEEDSYVWY